MTAPLLNPIVDVEALVSSFLRAQPEVTTLCGDRVYTDMPHDRVYPLVLVTRIGGAFVINHPLWLDRASIQLDTYGGTKKQAFTLLDACLSTMAARIVYRHEQGNCTGIEVDQLFYNPEPDSTDEQGHARPRFTVAANVLAHP
jgi:hypothetical protein